MIPQKRFKFLATTERQPCPICGKTSGSCSIGKPLGDGYEERYFCITHPDGGGKSGEYEFIKNTKDGVWGIYKKRGTSGGKTWVGMGFQKTSREGRKYFIGRQKRREKNNYFTWLLQHLRLEECDIDNLKKRGLRGEEIKSDIFGSTAHGLLIVFRDVFGNRVGAQIRRRGAKDGCRYFWYKSKRIEMGLPDGQVPIAVWQSEQSNANTIHLCEGYLKSYLAYCKFKREGGEEPWIGFGSASYLSSSYEEIKRTIKHLQVKELVFYPDTNSGNNKLVKHKYLEFWAKIKKDFSNLRLSIASWGQEFKSSCDIDELMEGTEIKIVNYENYVAYFRGIKIYERENRVKEWLEASKEHKYILDTSPPGTGKTYTAGQWGSPAIYLNNDHRNPTTKTLEDWVDVESRHGGLYRDGHGYLRRWHPEKGGNPEVSSNCYKHEVHQKMREKGYKSTQLCKSCEFFEECQRGEGEGYGYLYQRQKSLMSNNIRIHPDSLPNPDKYDYENKTIFIEEACDLSLVSELKASIYQLEKWLESIEKIKLNAKERNNLIKYIQELIKAIGEQRGKKYGVINPIEVPKISAATQLSLLETIDGEIGNITEPEEVDKTEWHQATGQNKQLLKQANKLLKRASQEPERLLREIEGKTNPIVSWLLCGNHSWIGNDGTLSVYRPKIEIQEIIKSAKNVIFLDATVTREKIGLIYGISPLEIHHVEAKRETVPNLKVVQIKDLGRLCQQRGKEQMRRLDELVKALKGKCRGTTRTIDLMKFATDGCWWRDSRGRNQFEDCDQLILIGTPARNLGQCLSHYLALGGNPHLFQSYYNDLIRSDITQGIGRIRAQQRPEKQLTVILITNYEIDGVTGQWEASSVCREAAPKAQQTIQKVADVYRQLVADNIKPTQKAIAERLRMARETVNRVWQKVMNLLSPAQPLPGLTPAEGSIFPNEEDINEYCEAIREIYEEFHPTLDTTDTKRLVLNVFSYIQQNPNNIALILEKINNKYGIKFLEKIENILDSS